MKWSFNRLRDPSKIEKEIIEWKGPFPWPNYESLNSLSKIPDLVNELKELGIESLYHKYSGEQQGAETNPTLYFQRKPERPYHIDYVFGAQRSSGRLKKLEIGQVDKWLEISDPMPILCEFD